jgi:hypothetical protein
VGFDVALRGFVAIYFELLVCERRLAVATA